VRPPRGASVTALVDASGRFLEGGPGRLLLPAPGPLAEAAVRINHTGAAAQPEPVLAALTALAGGLRQLGFDPDVNRALVVAERALFEPDDLGVNRPTR
jgi:hypothetical protein